MKSTSHKPHTHIKSVVKPIAFLVAFGLSQQAYALDGPYMHSPFTHAPLHLQDRTFQNSQGVPPNLLIQFDDSGSMLYKPEKDERPDASKNERSRIEVARSALQKVVTNPKYKGKFNWGLISLWGNEDSRLGSWSSKTYARDVVAGRRDFALNETTELLPLIRALGASGGTPAAERYLDAMHILRTVMDRKSADGKPLAYRCQKNYIILMSDGDAQGLIATPTITGNPANPSFKPANVADIKYLRYPQDPTSKYNFHSLWVAADNPYTYPFEDISKFTQFTKAPPVGPYYWPKPVSLLNATYGWNITRFNGDSSYGANHEVRPYTWGGHPDALPFLAALANTDLKTSGVDAAGKSWDDTTANSDGSTPNKVQNIRTFAIGFGNGLSAVGRYALDNMSTATNYKALDASDEASLIAAFDKALTEISNENTFEPPPSVSTIPPSLSYEDTTTQVPTAAATIHLDLASGSSEIRFYEISNTDDTYKVGSATYKTPLFSERKVLVNTGGRDNRVYWLQNLNLDNSFFKLTNSKNAGEWQNALLPWIARTKSDSEIKSQIGNEVPYRIRSEGTPNKRNMGDVIGASLYPVGESVKGYQKYLITAANDGMVYIFQRITNNANHPYSLKLNYMPAGMQRESADDTIAKHLKHIASDKYLTKDEYPHKYMINGDFTVRTTESSYPARTFMSGNLGQGGRGSYSLNISGREAKTNKAVGLDANESAWDSSVPLFETPKVGNTLGYTIGAPQIGRLSNNRTITFGSNGSVTQTTDLYNVYYATFVNSGINAPIGTEQENVTPPESRRAVSESALYVYSTLNKENVGLRGGKHGAIPYASGDLVSKIVASPNGGGLAQATIVDVDFDGVIDIAYAGDYNGNMYRFDLRGNPSTWKASRIFKTQANQPITSAPAVYREDANKYIVIFGTGSDLYDSDVDDTTIQSVYGIYDDLSVSSPSTVSQNNLLQQVLDNDKTVAGYKTRNLSTYPITPNQKGWFFNLDTEKESGERVVVKPTMLLKTVLLTTRSYKKDDSSSGNTNSVVDRCTVESKTVRTRGASWVMQFRADTGGKLPSTSTNGEDVDLFAYVDFAKANTDRKHKSRYADSLTTAFQMSESGIFSLITQFRTGDVNTIANNGNSTDMNGASRNGTDSPLNENPTVPRQCTSIDSKDFLIGSDSAKKTDASTGLNESVRIYAKVCQTASLKRISWREIF